MDMPWNDNFLNPEQAMPGFPNPWFALLAILLILFVSLRFLTPNKKRSIARRSANLPPSPPRLPIIGNLYQLGRLPHQSLWKLSQKYGPVMLLHLGSLPTVVISSADMAKDALKNHDLDFINHPATLIAKKISYNFLDLTFAKYGDHWREMRKIFVSELSGSKRANQCLWKAREAAVNDLIDALSLSSSSRDPINVDEKTFAVLDGVVCSVAFGERFGKKCFKGGKSLRDFLDRRMDLLNEPSVGDFIPSFGWILDIITGYRARLDYCFGKLDRFFQMVLDEHLGGAMPPESEEEKDFVDTLVGDLGLSQNHIKAFLMNIFIGGTDSTAVTMAWAMTEIGKSSRVMKKVQAEIRGCVGMNARVAPNDLSKLTYLKMVVKETLRLHPPFLVPRECVRHCKIGGSNGFDVYPKTMVLINAWGIGRDPNTWKNPNEFYPERFEENDIDFQGHHYELLPFGAGRRICPGLSMSVATIEYALANLLHCFGWEMPIGMKREDICVEEEGSVAIRRKTPLFLVPVKHHK